MSDNDVSHCERSEHGGGTPTSETKVPFTGFARADENGIWWGCSEALYQESSGHDIWKWRGAFKITDSDTLTRIAILMLLEGDSPAWLIAEGIGSRRSGVDSLVNLNTRGA